MGFSYRKSFKAGPIRVTASKSGISYSAGVKGARVTKRADGRVQTTLSAPGTGMRYTTTAGRPAARQTPRNGGPYTVISGRYTWAGEAARFKGLGFCRIRLYPDRVEIRRPGSRIVIPAHDILEVRSGAPSLSVHAYLWFVVPQDQAGYTSDSHQRLIMFNTFRPGHRRTWRHLVELLAQG